MRKNGNTGILADEFIRGAQEAGHETEKVELRDKTFGDCFGCRACHNNGGTCVQKDDMAEVLEKVKAVDVIVLASPLYLYLDWAHEAVSGPYLSLAAHSERQGFLSAYPGWRTG